MVKDKEIMENKFKSSCSICKKKFKNVLLHIDKQTKCKAEISEKDYNQLKEISEEVKRKRSRISMAKRRAKLRLEDSQGFKGTKRELDGGTWTGSDDIRKECNNLYKEKSRVKAREMDLEKVREDQRRWKRLSRKKAKEKIEEKVIPDRCPSCHKKKKSVLLHIQASESCHKNIDHKTYQEWVELSRQRSKSVFQYKYVEKGYHTKAQNKYLEKKREIKSDIERKKYIREKCEIDQISRKREFVRMSSECLLYLTQGRTPPRYLIWSYNLVLEEEVYYKGELLLTKDASNGWLKEFSRGFIGAAMTIQILVLIPKSKWLSAIKYIEQNQEKEELRDRLFRLIGKLQAGENEHTKDITIDKRYHSEKRFSSKKWCHKNAFNNHVLTIEDQEILVNFVADIVGQNEGLHRELIELLEITKDIDNLIDVLTLMKKQ